MDEATKKRLLDFQRSEITEHHIYLRLSQGIKNQGNKEILERLASEELKHYQFWKSFTETEVEPDRFKIGKYLFIARVLGLTFGLKTMERGEKTAQKAYDEISHVIPRAKEIEKDELEHEMAILGMIDEEKLRYVGSAVLGLNDALVELTGALAGFTLALQQTRLVAVAGLITGIAASLSMAASEYLSTKSESDTTGKNPLKACLYTGTAYVGTVAFLIFPFLVFPGIFFCLAFSLANAILVIFLFTYYISVAKDLDFKKRFFEMAAISLGVAAVSFVIGLIVRVVFKIEI